MENLKVTAPEMFEQEQEESVEEQLSETIGITLTNSEEMETLDTTEEEVVEEETTEEEVVMYQEAVQSVKKVGADLAARIREMQERGGERKRFVKATEAEKKVLYAEEHIHVIDERPGFKTESEKKRELFAELWNAARAGRVVTAHIDMVYPTADMVVAACYLDNIKIIIPLPYLVKSIGNIEGSKAEQIAKARSIVNLRVGSEVDFVIEQVNEKEQFVMANRLRGMDEVALTHYYAKRDNKYIINEGDIVEARVCYVTKTKVCIEAYGVEKVLSEKDCCWGRTADLRQDYYVGQRVKVRIMKLKRSKAEMVNGRRVPVLDVEFSIKEANPDARKDFYNMTPVGAVLNGEVVHVDKAGVFVNINRINYSVLCAPPKKFATPTVGKKVTLEIIQKDDEKYFMYGVIHRVLY